MELLTLNILLAAVNLTTVLFWSVVVLKVAVALGFVIFVHELGHFLVARACGVKCEKFMVGFDIGGIKLSRRWGETEYGIGIVPLGGYVKMLGQDDDPAHIAEQMKQSQIDAASGDGVQVTGPSGEKYYVDRRSYLAKSVPQRMAIISAGVVMNVIFAFIFATIAYGLGVPYVPSIVSEAVPGSPAWQAGLEPGDEIVRIADRDSPTFTQLRGHVFLGDLDEGIPIAVRRAADGETVERRLTPSHEAGRLARIGVSISQSLTLAEERPVLDHSPAARARLVASEGRGEAGQQPTALKGGDRVVRVGETPIESYREFAAELARSYGRPIMVTIERPAEKRSGGRSGEAATSPVEHTFEIEAQPLNEFGLVMGMGPIASVQADSPAAAAGLKEGDILEGVDGQPIAEGNDGLDPLALPEYLRQAALAGRQVELQVRRAAADEPLVLSAAPEVPLFLHSHKPLGTPMAAESLGIAYRVESEVRAIRSDGPAAASDLAPGDLLVAAKIVVPEDEKGKTSPPETIRFVEEKPGGVATRIRGVFGGQEPRRARLPNWPAFIDAVQFVPAGTEVEFTVQRGGEEHVVRLAPQPAAELYVAPRGLVFEPITRTRQAETLAAQIRYGGEETAQALTMVFRFLRKLGTQVPVTALGGPVTIARAAGYSAMEGLPSLLIFLTILSANLAVINFLPIPVLDGGHMVFLAYEGVRGRPATERFVIALHTAGFLFIVSLMLFVLALDFGWIPRNL